MDLGPRPWSDELLRRAYFSDIQFASTALSSLPGFAIDQAIDEIRGAVEVFGLCAVDLLSAIEDFKVAANDPKFWQRPADSLFERHEVILRKSLFAAASAALALVDSCRRVTGKHPVTGLEERRAKTFDRNEHEFIQELRNVMTHIHVVTPQWERTYRRRGNTTRLLLQRDQFRNIDRWKEGAKAYLAEHEEGVNVEHLFRNYATRVTEYYTWLLGVLEETYTESLTELRSYRRKLDGFGLHSYWSAMLSQVVIPRKLDPYIYLDQHLTAAELAEISVLAHRSREQVDRIIEIVDEQGFCDARLRQLVYRAFGVATGG